MLSTEPSASQQRRRLLTLPPSLLHAAASPQARAAAARRRTHSLGRLCASGEQRRPAGSSASASLLHTSWLNYQRVCSRKAPAPAHKDTTHGATANHAGTQIARLLPTSRRPAVAALQGDWYYCCLAPLMLPVSFIAVRSWQDEMQQGGQNAAGL